MHLFGGICKKPHYQPASIPSDTPHDKLIFSAKRYVSNGVVPDITHIVYVDPQKYSELASREDLLAVGRAVGKLNQRSCLNSNSF